MIFNRNENYLPSQRTINLSLFSKKKRYESYNAFRPGLIGVEGYNWQALAFILILLIEGGATIYAKSQGIKIEAIVVAIFVDIILAIAAHVRHSKLVRLKNEKVFRPDDQKGRILNSIKKEKRFKSFFNSLILFSGLFKAYLFFTAFGRINDIIPWGVAIFYMVAAILHVLFTGYFIFTSIYYISNRKDRKRFENSNRKENNHDSEKRIELKATEPISFKKVAIGKHAITQENDKYYLVTQGILTDFELDELIGLQEDDSARILLCKKGVEHQFNML